MFTAFSFRKIRLILTLFLCLPALRVHAAAEAESVLRATLDNGLRVIIVRDTLAPVVTTVINYLVGSDEAPEGFPGTAHAQEHMMFRGSPGLTADQLAKITAAMGGHFNADTQQTVTQYFFTVPSEDLDVALHIEAIRMRGILDDEQLWDKERGAIEQEVAQDLSNPEYVFYTKLLAAMFKGTPYAHDALGTRPSFDKTTAAMLKQFHDTWYAPNNAILVIVGDVQPEEALAHVKALFGDIPAKQLPPRPEVHLEPVQPETLKLDTDQPYGMVVASFRLPGFDDPDYAAVQVLADVLSSQRGNLYALVPEGKALFAGFSVSACRRRAWVTRRLHSRRAPTPPRCCSRCRRSSPPTCSTGCPRTWWTRRSGTSAPTSSCRRTRSPDWPWRGRRRWRWKAGNRPMTTCAPSSRSPSRMSTVWRGNIWTRATRSPPS